MSLLSESVLYVTLRQVALFKLQTHSVCPDSVGFPNQVLRQNGDGRFVKKRRAETWNTRRGKGRGKSLCDGGALRFARCLCCLPAFQLPMFAKCDTLPKGDLFDMFVQRIFFSQSFWDFQASTLQQKLQVPESGSTLHHLCIMVASCPSFRCSCRKKHPSHAEEQSVWSWSCGLQGLLQYSDCGLRFAMRLLQTKEYLSKLSF